MSKMFRIFTICHISKTDISKINMCNSKCLGIKFQIDKINSIFQKCFCNIKFKQNLYENAMHACNLSKNFTEINACS